MAGSLNRVTLIGNVGQDPEIRSFQSGGRVASFSLATSETWKDKNSGERKEKTEWHRLSVFSEGLVGVIERFVKKGSKIYVSGALETRKWQDKDGADKYTTEVVLRNFGSELILLDGKQGGEGGQASPVSSGGGQRRTAQASLADLDDEIPF